MLMIRFQRVGRKNDPAFRLVVTEKRSKPKSGELEILGSRHPKTKETALKNERILYWISKGAGMSPTAQNLLISKGVIKGKKIAVTKLPAVQVSAAGKKSPVIDNEPIIERESIKTGDKIAMENKTMPEEELKESVVADDAQR